MNLIRVTKASGWLLALAGACLCLGAIWLTAVATLDFARHGHPDGWSPAMDYLAFYGVIGAAALFGAGCAAVGVYWGFLFRPPEPVLSPFIG